MKLADELIHFIDISDKEAFCNLQIREFSRYAILL